MDQINRQVSNKFVLSAQILDTDYYAKVVPGAAQRRETSLALQLQAQQDAQALAAAQPAEEPAAEDADLSEAAESSQEAPPEEDAASH